MYRQTLSSLLLYVPYRFDVGSSLLDLEVVAIGFTTAGTSMMPINRYDHLDVRGVR